MPYTEKNRQILQRSADIQHDCPDLKLGDVSNPKAKLIREFPDIAAQAHGWDPAEVSSHSHKRLMWWCPAGHEYCCSVDQRTRGRSCPYCAGKQVLVGFNDLATVDPQLAAQAHGWDPKTVTRGSGKKQQWICSNGHVWSCSVVGRTRLNQCAVCSGKQVQVGVNDLATTDPTLGNDAHGWDPRTVTRGSAKRVNWICPEGHVYEMAVSQRVRGRNCGVCAGRRVQVGVNDLASSFPEIAREAHGWNPTSHTHGTTRKMPWKCKYGHTWTSSIVSRTRLGAGCPACAGNILQVGINDLVTKFPQIANEADGWDPRTIAAGSSQKKQWRCSKGHQWTTSVHSRTQRQTNCPYCVGLLPIVGKTDLASTHPELAQQADRWDPTTLKAGSNKKVGWKCPYGHTWTSVVFSRAVDGIGCPICSGKKVLAGFNDLATTDPQIAAQANGWNPTTVTKSSNKRVGWKCELNHTWTATVNNRTNGRDCPVCAGKTVLRGFNDLATTHPEIAAQAHGWDPTKVSKGNTQSRWWLCHEGHRWKTTPNGRTVAGTGCPTCSNSGFDPNEPGWLYLIEHDELEMFQIGISNTPEKRLNDHSKRGWEYMDIRGPMDGHLAKQIETELLREIERRGAVMGHNAGIKKFDGYTEAWLKNSLTVTGISQLLEWSRESSD